VSLGCHFLVKELSLLAWIIDAKARTTGSKNPIKAALPSYCRISFDHSAFPRVNKHLFVEHNGSQDGCDGRHFSGGELDHIREGQHGTPSRHDDQHRNLPGQHD
jgi:hypothetical protein